jgi:hypothetical protein
MLFAPDVEEHLKSVEEEYLKYLQACSEVDYIGKHLDTASKQALTKKELCRTIETTMRGRIIGDIFGSHETGGFSGVAEVEGHRIAFPLTT